MASRRYIGRSGAVYEPIERIGTPGGFGSVERVRDETGTEFAVKTLRLGLDAGRLRRKTYDV